MLNKIVLGVLLSFPLTAQITTILGTDTITASRTTINNNFSYLDTYKIQKNTANTYSGGGLQDFSAAKWKPPLATVATLPAAAASTAYIYQVTDGASATDCTAGSSSTRVLCVSTGSAWVSIGGGGGGGSTTWQLAGTTFATESIFNFTAGTGISLTSSNPAGKGQLEIASDTAVIVIKTDLQAGTNLFVSSSTGSDTYTACPSGNTLTAYTNGQVFNFRAVTLSTGAATLNICTLGAKSLVASDGSSDPGILAGRDYRIAYDSSIGAGVFKLGL